MTQEEYNSTDWNRGNRVRLTNGKEYLVRRQKKRFLILYSAEYDAFFIADHHIIVCRTSDFIEPFPPKKAAHCVEASRVGECSTNAQPAKEEASSPSADEALAPSAAEAPAISATEAQAPAKPKRKRSRITIFRTEKVEF